MKRNPQEANRVGKGCEKYYIFEKQKILCRRLIKLEDNLVNLIPYNIGSILLQCTNLTNLTNTNYHPPGRILGGFKFEHAYICWLKITTSATFSCILEVGFS